MIVTDGFTGNVALKTIEGALRAFAGLVFAVLDSTPEAQEAAQTIMPLLLQAAETYDPDIIGGAVLLGHQRGLRDLARIVVGAGDRQRGRGRRRLRRHPGSGSHEGGHRRCRLRPTSNGRRSAPTRCCA